MRKKITILTLSVLISLQSLLIPSVLADTDYSQINPNQLDNENDTIKDSFKKLEDKITSNGLPYIYSNEVTYNSYEDANKDIKSQEKFVDQKIKEWNNANHEYEVKHREWEKKKETSTTKYNKLIEQAKKTPLIKSDSTWGIEFRGQENRDKRYSRDFFNKFYTILNPNNKNKDVETAKLFWGPNTYIQTIGNLKKWELWTDFNIDSYRKGLEASDNIYYHNIKPSKSDMGADSYSFWMGVRDGIYDNRQCKMVEDIGDAPSFYYIQRQADYAIEKTKKYNWTSFTNMQLGSQFWLKNAGKTHSGKRIHIKFTVRHLEYGNRIGARNPCDRNNPLKSNWWPLFIGSYKAIGSRNEDTAIIFQNYFGEFKLDLEFFDDDGNPLNILIGTIITDVDYYQGILVEGNKFHSDFLPNHSYLSKGNTRFPRLSRNLIHDPLGEGYNDVHSIPAGSFMTVNMGNRFHLEWGGGGYFDIFGKSFTNEIIEKEIINIPSPEKPKSNNYAVSIHKVNIQQTYYIDPNGNWLKSPDEGFQNKADITDWEYKNTHLMNEYTRVHVYDKKSLPPQVFPPTGSNFILISSILGGGSILVFPIIERNRKKEE